MKNSITSIIFDFGNVLVKWEPEKIFQRYFPDQPQAVEKFFRDVKFMEWNAQQDKGRSFTEGVELLANEFPHYEPAIRGFHEYWEESLGGEISGSVELLRALKEKGYLMFGLSNWSAETFPVARRHYPCFNLLDGIVLSGEVKMIKPDPAIYEHCLQKMNRTASECLFIDDSEPNIITANKLGFNTIHFKSPEQLREEIQKRELL
jgi:2-haloacid dehalogenase